MPRYEAAGDRCAVDLDELLKPFKIPIAADQALKHLAAEGFSVIEADVERCARSLVGRARYRRGAHPRETPEMVDCSTLTKWCYAMRGIRLSRYAYEQRECGVPVQLADIAAGDLIFASGAVSRYIADPEDGVGHVGIATSQGTVIHAASAKRGVVEVALEDFLSERKFRGIRRYLPEGRRIVTLKIPPSRCVETSHDLRWVVLQMLPKKQS